MGCKNRRDPMKGEHKGCNATGHFGTYNANAKPLRVVRIATFSLSRHELTVAEWNDCASRGGCGQKREYDSTWQKATHPVNVTWDEAQEYAAWLSRETGETYRLASEAEWEYAARAGTSTRFSWGMDAGRPGAKCCGESRVVASFAPNPFGLYDMHGNDWGEWVQDCWNGTYGGAPRDGSAWDAGRLQRPRRARLLPGKGTGASGTALDPLVRPCQRRPRTKQGWLQECSASRSLDPANRLGRALVSSKRPALHVAPRLLEKAQPFVALPARSCSSSFAARTTRAFSVGKPIPRRRKMRERGHSPGASPLVRQTAQTTL